MIEWLIGIYPYCDGIIDSLLLMLGCKMNLQSISYIFMGIESIYFKCAFYHSTAFR